MGTNEQIEMVASGLRGLVAGTRRDQLDLPTPCTEWQVRDLLNHFTGGGHMFAALLRGEAPAMPDGPPPDLLGDDHTAAFDGAIADFSAALTSPGAMDRDIPFPSGAMPAPMAMQLLVADLLVHSWDLSTATGQAFSPPDDLVTGADAFIRQIIPAGHREGMPFASEVEAPEGATPLQRLVAYCGRRA